MYAKPDQPTKDEIEAKKLAVDTLLAEYHEWHGDVRQAVDAMDINFRYVVTTLSAIIGAWLSFEEPKILFVAPTLLFMFGIAHLGKSATQSVFGTYLYRIEQKLKAVVGEDNIAMDWETSKLREYFVSFRGAPQMSTNIIFAIFIAMFLGISWAAYQEYPWTIFLHGAEVIAFAAYAWASTRYVYSRIRTDYWKKYR